MVVSYLLGSPIENLCWFGLSPRRKHYDVVRCFGRSRVDFRSKLEIFNLLKGKFNSAKDPVVSYLAESAIASKRKGGYRQD